MPSDPSNSSRHSAESADSAEKSDGDALAAVVSQCRELGEYLLYYGVAKKDRLALSIKQFGVRLAVGVIAFAALVELMGVSIGYLVSGLAGGLSILFGNRVWAGNLVTGFTIVAAITAGVVGAIAYQCRLSRNKTMKNYEQRQDQQQSRFGHSVASEAAAGRSQCE